MKNSNSYLSSTISFFDEILSKKYNTSHDKGYKDRIAILRSNVSLLFDTYDIHFGNNSLEKINSFGYSGLDKLDLQNLYSYKSKTLQALMVLLTTTHSNRVEKTCQYCTIGEINSFDHILPQEEFPEFIVNPKNLFPACSKCNSYKNSLWKKAGSRIFLNLYIDRLPSCQYLFADVHVYGDLIDIDFHLNNIFGIDEVLFERIENHYNRLFLLERFLENSNEVITTLDSMIIAGLETSQSFDELKNIIINAHEIQKKSFGQNYWKSVLVLSIINNNQYRDRFVI